MAIGVVCTKILKNPNHQLKVLKEDQNAEQEIPLGILSAEIVGII